MTQQEKQQTMFKYQEELQRYADDNGIDLSEAGKMFKAANCDLNFLTGYIDPEKLPNKIEQTETVTGEVIPAGLVFDLLPASVVANIHNIITNYCAEHGTTDPKTGSYIPLDMRTAASEDWRACCMLIGSYIKINGIIEDKEGARRAMAGKKYDPYKVNELVDLWAWFCMDFRKNCLIGDFSFFAGVSTSWVDGIKPDGSMLTSAAVGLSQKLHKIQELSLTGRLADGRQNPTGAIFILKNLHGWRDEREVVHTDGGQRLTAAELPKLGTIDE